MQDLNDKSTGGNLTAAEWNQVPSEIQNVIEGLGQTLSGGDLNQLGKGIAGYVANGIFYTDSGAADAHVLTTIGAKQSPTAYTDGFRAVFRAAATNTGATTVNVATLGVKNIFFDGAALTGGEIVSGAIVTLIYDNSNGRFDLIPELSKLYSNGSIIGIGAVPDLGVGLHIKTGDSGSGVNVNGDELVIENSAASGLSILSGAASIGSIYFSDSGSSIAGLIRYDHSTDSLTLFTGTTLRVNIDQGLYMDGATGGDQGADTINASAYYIDGVLFQNGSFVNNANGNPNLSDTTFNVASSLTINTWEEIGPTGATNVWAALNALPTDIDWIEVKINVNGSDAASSAEAFRTLDVFARDDGSVQAANATLNNIGAIDYTNDAAGNGSSRNVSTHRVPVTSRKFEGFWSGDAVSKNITLVLTGYGWNI